MKKFTLLCGLFLCLFLLAGCCGGDCHKKCPSDQSCCGTCGGVEAADCCGTCGGDKTKADAKKIGG